MFPVMLIASLIITSLATFGLGSLLAALNVKYRDFRYVIPFMVQALLFVTPVILPLSVVAARWQYVLAINPMYSAIELFRYSLTGLPLQLNLIYISLCSTLFFTIVGLVYFRKTEAYFADVA
jgi:lipopolysaccharide transport system permease protein